MLNLKILNIKNLPILILILCLVSIGTEITFLNKIFWITLVFISYFLLKFKTVIFNRKTSLNRFHNQNTFAHPLNPCSLLYYLQPPLFVSELLYA